MGTAKERFDFRGHATGMSMWIDKIRDREVNLVSPVHGDSKLPPHGGKFLSAADGSKRTFKKYFSYGKCGARSDGARRPDGTYLTTAKASVKKLQITEFPSKGEGKGPNIFRLESLSLGIQSEYPPKEKYPTLSFTDLNPYGAMSLCGRPITLVLNKAWMRPRRVDKPPPGRRFPGRLDRQANQVGR
ncbi:MAG: hypothetical protein HYR60_29195 [Acidobacteria bacterium]|nr:hypothetical protein [Acidobacteriota bacterium]MBI3470524.1 hypothetical protein [Candidatus Solibacter usitatus]